jgi:hypothetical protein
MRNSIPTEYESCRSKVKVISRVEYREGIYSTKTIAGICPIEIVPSGANAPNVVKTRR